MIRGRLIWLSVFFLPLPSYGQSAVLSTEQTKVLYRGFENKVNIAVPGYTCDDLKLEAAHCNLKGEGCSYLVTPDSVSPLVFVIRSKRDKKLIDTVTVPVRHIPEPRVKIAEGWDNKGAILKEAPVVTGDDGSNLEGFFRIMDFEVTMLSGDSIIYQHKIIGAHFDAATKAMLESAQTGDKLFVEEIHVMAPDGRRRLFNNIAYIFK